MRTRRRPDRQIRTAQDAPVQSSLWYRAALSGEQLAAGALTLLCEQFAVAVREAGEPEGACLFAVADDVLDDATESGPGGGTAMLFFSPTAISLVPQLLAKCGAGPSDAPKRPRATLLVGRQADWNLLPRATH